MKAVRYHGSEDKFRVDDVSKPTPKVNEVLVRVSASGICPMDLQVKHVSDGAESQPVTVGHEAVGVIEEVGQGVSNSRIDERVIVYYYSGCGECRHCRRGEENLCDQAQTRYGFTSDGGHAEYMTVPARNTVSLSDKISDIQAVPIACGLTSAVHAVHRADLRYGELAAVYGLGNTGFNIVQLANAYGARVVAIDRKPVKLEKARELGADVVVDVTKESVVDRLKEVDLGKGFDVVFDCVGQQETLTNVLEVLGTRGRLILTGYSDNELVISPTQFIAREQKLIGTAGAALQDLYEAVNLVESGEIRTVVDRSMPLEDYEKGLQAMEQSELVGQAVLVPN